MSHRSEVRSREVSHRSYGSTGREIENRSRDHRKSDRRSDRRSGDRRSASSDRHYHRRRHCSRSRSRSRSPSGRDSERRRRKFSSSRRSRSSSSSSSGSEAHVQRRPRRNRSNSKSNCNSKSPSPVRDRRSDAQSNSTRDRSRWTDAAPQSSVAVADSLIGSYGTDRRSTTAASAVEASVQQEHPPSGSHYGPASEEDAADAEETAPQPVEKANFGLTGALAKDERTGNMVNGVVLKCSEPLDACMPQRRWRLYVFKAEELVETLHIHRKSFYLLGRDKRVCDVLLLHPSCSSQHAVIQFRTKRLRGNAASGGAITEVVRPYIMDLASTHRTFVNGVDIEDARYVELRERDYLRFGASSREYVLMCEDTTAEES